MTITQTNDLLIFGNPEPGALEQMQRCMATAMYGVLNGDNHKGYGVPIGGVLAYVDAVSPTGVGYDIGCGNKAVMTNIRYNSIKHRMHGIMDDVWGTVSFGVGRKNATTVEHSLFNSSEWGNNPLLDKNLLYKAQEQLGTVGSGNHYVDIFRDGQDRVWVGVHFGSRGLGHTIATRVLALAGGKDGMDVDPVVLDADSELGLAYIAAMRLAGEYAYAGRDWVTAQVVDILGGKSLFEVHNHHNFAWEERHFGVDMWVVRKGATPAFPGQHSFIGASMGEVSYIVRGVDSELSRNALYSTVHGAGRVMSRTQAKKTLSSEDMRKAMVGIELRGADLDEAPMAYKRLDAVLAEHSGTIEIVERLYPVGVAMAGKIVDPYKD